MYKIAVLGDKKSISLFKASGFYAYYPEDEYKAIKILEKLKNDNFGVVYIADNIYEKISEKLSYFPFIITPFPTIYSVLKKERNALDKAIKKAMGGIK